MGGRLQARWSRKAKKRRLLLIMVRVLLIFQLGVVGTRWIVSRLGISGRETD